MNAPGAHLAQAYFGAMDAAAISDLVVAALARYDRSNEATDTFFDEAWLVLAPEGTAALNATVRWLESAVPADRAGAAEIIGRVGEANDGATATAAWQVLFARLPAEQDPEFRDALSPLKS